jgi:hypothetical protein
MPLCLTGWLLLLSPWVGAQEEGREDSGPPVEQPTNSLNLIIAIGGQRSENDLRIWICSYSKQP